MTSFWGALDRALQFDGSKSRVCDRVNQAFANWTRRAESDLTVVSPLGFDEAEEVQETVVPTVQASQAGGVKEERGCAAESAEIPVYPPEHIRTPWVGGPAGSAVPTLTTDYYEILQISRSAEMETIHRVYRIMAARFHPDNTLTGNLEKFLALREAYQVLSNPKLRAEYDRRLYSRAGEALPAVGQKGFAGGPQTEINRRLGVLSLLYNQRRVSEARPGVSMLDLERLMSLPREHLQFTLWYLKSKGYIAVEDHSDYGVTPAGVDYLEEQSGKNKLTRELLTGAPETRTAERIARAVPVVPVKKVGRRRAARRSRRALTRRAEPAA